MKRLDGIRVGVTVVMKLRSDSGSTTAPSSQFHSPVLGFCVSFRWKIQMFFFFCKSVSLYGCFLEWWYPPFHTPSHDQFLVGTPMVVGYHHFRNPPYTFDSFSIFQYFFKKPALTFIHIFFKKGFFELQHLNLSTFCLR